MNSYIVVRFMGGPLDGFEAVTQETPDEILHMDCASAIGAYNVSPLQSTYHQKAGWRTPSGTVIYLYWHSLLVGSNCSHR